MLATVLKAFLFLLIAALVGSLLGTMFSTVHMLSGLTGIGVSLPTSTIIQTFLNDLKGLTPLMTALFIPGFIIAFLVSRYVARALPDQRTIIFSVAGGVSVLTTFILMKTLLGVSPISAVRSPTGLGFEVLAGVIAGYVFINLQKRTAA